MSEERRHYISYLLRLWPASEKGTQVWRASLDSPVTRERQGFASLEGLCEFLHKQLETDKDEPNSENHEKEQKKEISDEQQIF